MNSLTFAQIDVMAYLESCAVPPTLDEIGAHFGTSHSSAKAHVCALEKKGRVTREHYRRRSIVVIKPLTASERLLVARGERAESSHRNRRPGALLAVAKNGALYVPVPSRICCGVVTYSGRCAECRRAA